MSQTMTSSIVPPPPPPPAVLLNRRRYEPGLPNNFIINECLWSIDNPELQRACYFNRVCQHDKPKQCLYNDVTSILQKGPTCGLTAISMLLNGAITTEHLVNVARSCHYTNHGEMFSAKYLYDLLCDQSKKNKFSCHAMLHEGRLNCDKIKDCLQTGDCLIVPYPFYTI